MTKLIHITVVRVLKINKKYQMCLFFGKLKFVVGIFIFLFNVGDRTL